MEYIDGLDLNRLVEADGPLDFEIAADYIRQAADGLQHGHEQHMSIATSSRPTCWSTSKGW